MPSQFPLILVRDLPQLAITPDSNTTIPVVQNNQLVGRISWELYTANLSKLATSTPIDPHSSGEENQFVADSTGIYAYKNGEWHKAPVYNSNWNELTVDTRFMLVNTSMTLSDAELANVRNTLRLQIANQETAGLVRAMTAEEQAACSGAPVIISAEGTQSVLNATSTTPGVVTVWDGTTGNVATAEYVRQQLAILEEHIDFPIAQVGIIGGVQADPAQEDGTAGIFSVTSTGQVKIRKAYAVTEPEEEDGYGLVRLASSIHPGDSGTTTAAQVYNYFSDWKDQALFIASAEQAGIVRPYTDGVWEDEAYTDPTKAEFEAAGGLGALFFRDEQGGIDVRPAGMYAPGVVICHKTIPENSEDIDVHSTYPIVPSLYAIKTYVDTKVQTATVSVHLPGTTFTSLGGIQLNDNAFLLSGTGIVSLQTAAPGTRGVVQMATSTEASQDNYAVNAYLLKSHVASSVAVVNREVTQIKSNIAIINTTTADLQEQINEIVESSGGGGGFHFNVDINGMHQSIIHNTSNIAFLTEISNDNSSAIGSLTGDFISEINYLSEEMTQVKADISALQSAVTWLSSQV